jgi:hypothetical protein
MPRVLGHQGAECLQVPRLGAKLGDDDVVRVGHYTTGLGGRLRVLLSPDESGEMGLAVC